MKFDIILGRAGSGKTEEILSHAGKIISGKKELPRGLTSKTLIIVPDQYTVVTEKRCMERFGERGMPFVKILSLKRLASFLFTENGGGRRVFLSGGGRSALVMKAVHTVSDGFSYYPPESGSPRFISLMSGAISELRQSGADPEAFHKAAALENDAKLKDISLCYTAYSALLDGGNFDDADRLSMLAELIASKKLFEDADIFCESFRLFTAQELKVLEAFIISGANLTVSLPSEARSESRLSLFSASGECVGKLRGFASKCGIKPSVTVLEPSRRYKSKELAMLESGFFRDKKETFSGKPADISVYRASDPLDEAQFAASRITELVRDGGYSYSDFLILARNMESYAAVLEPVFEKYDIPLFYHKKTPLRKKSVVLLIQSLFDVLINGITRETALTILKTGLTGVSVEDIALFENYTMQWSISYDRLLKDFTLSVNGFSENEDSEEDKALLRRINETRKYVAGLIGFFKNELGHGKKTVTEISKALCTVFDYIKLPKRLDELTEKYISYGEDALAAEQKQVYELVVDSLDEFVFAAGDDTVTYEEYIETLLSVIEDGDIGIIPVFSDAVTAGGAETTPQSAPKCVFVIGMMNGVFPKTDAELSLFDMSDKIKLEKYELEVGKSDTQRILYERFLAYCAVSAPSEKLFVSYNTGSGDAHASSAVTEIKRMFPALKELSFPSPDDTDELEERLQNADFAYEIGLKYNIPALEEYFERKGLSYNAALPETTLSEDSAKALFGKNQTLSASRVTSFYKCRFGYFFRYGMNLKEKRQAKLDAMETGNFIHAALRYVLEEGGERGDAELEASLSAFAAEYLKKLFGEEELGAGLKKHFAELVRRVLRLLKLFREELKQSKFKPAAYELEVSDESGLKPIRIPYGDGYVTMIGKIDRVDVYERDGKKYLRVVDYKSGSKSFSVEELYYGLDIQMLVYLYALKEHGEDLFGSEPEPAGCMYVNANPVTVSIKRNEGLSDAEKELDKKRGRSGIFLNDPDVLRAMDAERRGKYIPVKEGDTKSLATAEEFGKLFLRINELLRDVASETSSGRIYKDPVTSGGIDTCKYCDYAKYCENEGCGKSLQHVGFDNIYELIDSAEGEGKA